MDAMQVLVIILSIFLAIFLLLAIVLTIQLLKVTKQIKSITTTTQNAVEKVNNLASTAAKFASPAIIAQIVGDQIKKYKKGKKEK
jgi:regulatory protein YycI of two-component signal transduction system YycFG